jgi:hypothetical protein
VYDENFDEHVYVPTTISILKMEGRFCIGALAAYHFTRSCIYNYVVESDTCLNRLSQQFFPH